MVYVAQNRHRPLSVITTEVKRKLHFQHYVTTTNFLWGCF